MNAERTITPELVRRHHLTNEEYQHIVQRLGREPNVTELGMFSVSFSEHCCYKSSKRWLKRFPTEGKQILVPAGAENAGAVAFAPEVAIVFKIESHNHPSAVEPHAGAATGVGGIVRDIFTMGARPIALFDALRFGDPATARTRFLVDGVVRGISDYGNCLGIPTVGGELVFNPVYQENPLVNVMCIGVVHPQRIATAKASGIGNPVLYVGSRTGRDGLGGASFASREITEGSEADRPAVQIGDPFAEKCLIEATLEALATGLVIGIQDMGAAGLTCSTTEMASRGRTGMAVDLGCVPRREEGMTPYELMLSESQERMLLVVQRGGEARIQQIFAKWDLPAVVIGRVTGDQQVRLRDDGVLAADLPVDLLTTDAPVYDRPRQEPAWQAGLQQLDLSAIPAPSDYAAVLERLLAHPTIGSARWVFEQYDHMVQTNTVVRPGGDAAVLRIKGCEDWLAATTDGNSTYCLLDPYVGGQLAVCEAARNLVCVGAEPLAITNCLNFGNPEDPAIMWQFARCVEGIAEACRVLETPVTGGNVSFYNESPLGAIDPTPIIGMIGVIRRSAGALPIRQTFQEAGDVIFLLGTTREELGGSLYLQAVHGLKRGRPPQSACEEARRLHAVALEAMRQGWVRSAHDCAEGGLAVALAECAILSTDQRWGAVVAPPDGPLRPDAWLFGESANRIIVTCRPEQAERLERLAARERVACHRLGRVEGRRLRIGSWIDVEVDRLAQVYETAVPRALGVR